jgi:MGT family glycosyltransferase
MNILFVVAGYYGHVNPTYSIAKALAKSGHKVNYYGLGINFKDQIEKVGANLLDFPEFLTKEQKEEKKIEETELTDENYLWAQDDATYAKSYVASCYKYFESDVKEFEYFYKLTRDQQYDLIIGDKLHSYGIILAKTLQIPFIQSDYHIFYTHKEEHEIMRLQNLPIEYKQQINIECLGKFNNYLKTAFTDPVIPAVSDIDEYVEFYTNPKHKVIIYAPEILFNINKLTPLPMNYLFLGDRFGPVNLKEHHEGHSGENNFYVSLGTIMNMRSQTFVKIIEELKKISAKAVISVGGEKQVYEELKDFNSDNIKISLFVNQTDTLKETGIFISHGGANSIYESLYYGVPMILIPH